MPANKKDLSGKPAKMTHQHFRFIAEVIRKMPTHAATLRTQQVSTANSFADALDATNPMFDRTRFLAACGV
jgi:hypothetical protein